MSRYLTKYEQETIVNFNRAEEIAYVFTYDKSWQRHIENKLGIKPTEANGFGGRSYTVPKKCIKPPLAPRRLSAEARAKLVARAKGMNRRFDLKEKSTVIIG